MQKGPMQKGQLTTPELWKLLHETAGLTADPVYYFIDRVDESKKGANELIQRIHVFLQDHCNFRFLLVGRQAAFHSLGSVRYILEIDSGTVNNDVEHAIRDKIAQSDTIDTSLLEQEVLGTLQQKSGGNFLWVKLMI